MTNSESAEEIVEVSVPGVMTWRSRTVKCGECDANTGLTLRLEVHRWWGLVGDRAGVVCSAGHWSLHPLIYPEVIRLVVVADGDMDNLRGQLASLPWWPHRESYVQYPFDMGTAAPSSWDHVPMTEAEIEQWFPPSPARDVTVF